MPVVTEWPVRAFAFCRVPLCPGYAQEEVDARRVETGFSFIERGGDIPGTESSAVDLRFADAAVEACPSCGRARELSLSSRPSYDPLSGFDPMALANGVVGAFEPGKVNTVEDAKVAELEAKNVALEAKLDAILEKLGGDD